MVCLFCEIDGVQEYRDCFIITIWKLLCLWYSKPKLDASPKECYMYLGVTVNHNYSVFVSFVKCYKAMLTSFVKKIIWQSQYTRFDKKGSQRVPHIRQGWSLSVSTLSLYELGSLCINIEF